MTTDDAGKLREQILGLCERYAQVVHGPAPFVPGTSAVPPSGKVLGPKEMRLLVDSCLDFWLTTGRFNADFERQLTQRTGVLQAITTNSGSSANLLATTALTSHLLGDEALQPGDEVITCATGFPTTVNPALQNGLVPVFLDVELGTYNIDVRYLEEAKSARTRAIMVAHTLGNPFDLGAITSFAKKHDLLLVEDCCDALGATYDGKKVGTFGALGTLSFYPAHHITMGEGGAVLCNRMIFKRIVESIRDWGRDCYCDPGKDNTCNRRFDWQLGELPYGYDHKYTYSHLGYNLKITDMQAAVGLAQLESLDAFVATRRRNWQYLWDGLSNLQDILLLPTATANSDPSWFGFCITLRPEAPFDREELMRFLNERKIGTRLLFAGNLLRQPYMKGRNYRTIGPLENSDMVMTRTFWIGVYPGLSQQHLDYVLETMHGFFRAATTLRAESPAS
ncbi:lipopolysaccharide biosynthesis protein RfbH [Methylovirgula sp. HY1]|uniref:lipopolysaccharide biosynthesis protein RfbH n=1 Tax=Methylovirgula sp. HY1 TaxID=2822761 RepID=UPI001C5AC62A|nr:lipopolysaccharide biosynthesis protein RfbH [Methylovirgula sp. HY1]QXX76668.1 GDP-4-keto-6-deoxy-D-mannose-3-dehydratase / pyridoxamine-phosphate transaminase [Methylovirgula sp. HY1]